MIQRKSRNLVRRIGILKSTHRPIICFLLFLTLIFGSLQLPVPSERLAQASPSNLGKIAFVRDGDIWIMNADGSAQRILYDIGPGEYADQLTWSPKGDKLVFGRYSSEDGGAAGAAYINADGTGYSDIGYSLSGKPSWSADGTKIAFETEHADPGIYIHDLVKKSTDFFAGGSIPRWSRDGRLLAYDDYDANTGTSRGLGVWDSVNGKTSFYQLPKGVGYFAWAYDPMQWGKNADVIFYQDPDFGINEFNISSKESRYLTDGYGIAFSPKNNLLATAQREDRGVSNSIKLLNLTTKEEKIVFLPRPRKWDTFPGNYSGDGKQLVFSVYGQVGGPGSLLISEIWVAETETGSLHKIADNASEPACPPVPSAEKVIPTRLSPPYILNPEGSLSPNGITTSSDHIDFSGLSQPYMEIILYREGKEVAKGSSDERGYWKIEDVGLERGTNHIVAKARDNWSSEESPESKTATINYEPYDPWKSLKGTLGEIGNGLISIPRGIWNGIVDLGKDVYQAIRHPVNSIKGAYQALALLTKDQKKLLYMSLCLGAEPAFKANREANPGLASGRMIAAVLEKVGGLGKLLQELGASKYTAYGFKVFKTGGKLYRATKEELNGDDYEFLFFHEAIVGEVVGIARSKEGKPIAYIEKQEVESSGLQGIPEEEKLGLILASVEKGEEIEPSIYVLNAEEYGLSVLAFVKDGRIVYVISY